MRNGLLSAAAVLCAAALARAQAPPPPPYYWAPLVPAGNGFCPTPEAVPYVHEEPPSPPCEPGPVPLPPCKFTWITADYLLWNTSHAGAPPLVTRGSSADTIPGALGQRGTSVLVADSIDEGQRDGARFTLGTWFDPTHHLGIDGSFLFLSRSTTNFSGASGSGANGVVLARPYFDVNTNGENAVLIARPGLQSGSFSGALTNQFYAADANLRHEFITNCTFNASLLAGFRYLDLDENLRLDSTSTLTAAFPLPAFAGAGVTLRDSFRTTNSFYGGQLGTEMWWSWHQFNLNLLGKVALGVDRQTATIDGASTVTLANGTTTPAAGGLLALPSNSGQFSRNEFCVVSEATASVGYAFGEHVRLSVGYTYLYASNVARAADQIDRNLNLTQAAPPVGQGALVGAPQPAFTFHTSSFSAQGLTLGLAFRF